MQYRMQCVDMKFFLALKIKHSLCAIHRNSSNNISFFGHIFTLILKLFAGNTSINMTATCMPSNKSKSTYSIQSMGMWLKFSSEKKNKEKWTSSSYRHCISISKIHASVSRIMLFTINNVDDILFFIVFFFFISIYYFFHFIQNSILQKW